MRKVLMAALVLGALASPSAADRADDDLAAVKKAVGTTVEAEAKPPAEAPPARAEQARADERRREDRARSHKSGPQWIRVRIAEKGEKRARVSLNLPLDIVRALGEDVKIEDCHHGHHSLGDVLRALDSGERLVDIEDEEATVRVWVE